MSTPRRAPLDNLNELEHQEHVRAGRGAWLDDVGRDVRYALRTCAHNSAFSAVIVITLALGIGANTAVFSLVDTLMLRSLALRQPEQRVEPLFKYPRDPWLNLYRWTDYEGIRHDSSRRVDTARTIDGDAFRAVRRDRGPAGRNRPVWTARLYGHAACEGDRSAYGDWRNRP